MEDESSKEIFFFVFFFQFCFVFFILSNQKIAC